MSSELLTALTEGAMEVKGRLVDASNATLLVEITHHDQTLQAIYKPIMGERPLWDFPDGQLAFRERASYLISEAAGFHLVPLTILRDGPFGEGMVQHWIDIDEEVDLALYFKEDNPQLRSVALFDAIINNTDRKIGHLLPAPDGTLYICDHGVTFHCDDKLRTVLWQWSGEQLNAGEITQLEKLRSLLADDAITELPELLTKDEIQALAIRIESLLASGTFPVPSEDWPAIPWPPF